MYSNHWAQYRETTLSLQRSVALGTVHNKAYRFSNINFTLSTYCLQKEVKIQSYPADTQKQKQKCILETRHMVINKQIYKPHGELPVYDQEP